MKIIPRTRANEILSLIERGLEDVSFSRPAKDLPWGVPVPDDGSQTMYVWCDALANYLSVLDYAEESEKFKNSGRPMSTASEKTFCVSTPPSGPDAAFGRIAVAEGDFRPRVYRRRGRKMSKSLGNVVDPWN